MPQGHCVTNDRNMQLSGTALKIEHSVLNPISLCHGYYLIHHFCRTCGGGSVHHLIFT